LPEPFSGSVSVDGRRERGRPNRMIRNNTQQSIDESRLRRCYPKATAVLKRTPCLGDSEDDGGRSTSLTRHGRVEKKLCSPLLKV